MVKFNAQNTHKMDTNVDRTKLQFAPRNPSLCGVMWPIRNPNGAKCTIRPSKCHFVAERLPVYDSYAARRNYHSPLADYFVGIKEGRSTKFRRIEMIIRPLKDHFYRAISTRRRSRSVWLGKQLVGIRPFWRPSG